ncbi:MAG: hypothetical protein H5T61_08670 [Thermoflexales bacterium]|nr:hypothetical protein [Thermoflexales bacterium]
MASPEIVTVRAEQVEGLRELIRQVIEEERLFPREYMIDVEALRRSPAGAVIRLEERIEHLSAKIEELGENLEALRTEMQESLGALRAEMLKGQEDLRAEFKRELSNLEKLMEARFDALEQRISRTDFWVKFFAGLVSALFVAQLALSLIR